MDINMKHKNSALIFYLTFLTCFFLAGFLAAVDFGFAFTVLVFLVAVFFAGAFSVFSIALANFSMFFFARCVFAFHTCKTRSSSVE
jgi:hypothetical protein